MLTTQKLVFAGDNVYLYHFENPVAYGSKEGVKKRKTEDFIENIKVEESKEQMRARALNRAKNKVILLTNTNYNKWKNPETGEYFKSVYLVLTFKQNITDIKYANREFSKFIQRLNYHITKLKKSYLKYVWTIEFQKRGAIHYNVIIFNMPYIENDTLQEIWKHGYIDIQEIKDIGNVGSYISKYISKTFDDKRLHGEKCYAVSRGLKKPLIIRNIRDINFFLTMLEVDKAVYKTSYKNDHQGEVDVFQYDLRNGPYSYEDFQAVFALKYGTGVE